MRKTIYALTALATVTGASAVYAQAATATTEAGVTAKAETPVADAAVEAEARTFTDAEVKGFAAAALATSDVQADASIPEAEKGQALIAAVESAGIDAATYNDIAAAMQTDEALKERIAVALSEMASASTDTAVDAEG